MISPAKAIVVEVISPVKYVVRLNTSCILKTVRLSSKFVMNGIRLEVGDKLYIQEVESSRMDGYVLTKVDFKGTNHTWEEGFFTGY